MWPQHCEGGAAPEERYNFKGCTADLKWDSIVLTGKKKQQKYTIVIVAFSTHSKMYLDFKDLTLLGCHIGVGAYVSPYGLWW